MEGVFVITLSIRVPIANPLFTPMNLQGSICASKKKKKMRVDTECWP